MSAILVSLLLATASGEADAKPAKVDPRDTVRCVREDVIGSIAQKRKVCHTLREWESIRRNAQDESRRITQLGIPGQVNSPGN